MPLIITKEAAIKPIGDLPGATLDILKGKLTMDNPEKSWEIAL